MHCMLRNMRELSKTLMMVVSLLIQIPAFLLCLMMSGIGIIGLFEKPSASAALGFVPYWVATGLIGWGIMAAIKRGPLSVWAGLGFLIALGIIGYNLAHMGPLIDA